MAVSSSSSAGLWILEPASLLVVVLLAAHVSALVYWMYRLASDKQAAPRRKTH